MIDELQLLAGIPINIMDICSVRPPKLIDIARLGELDFYMYVNNLTADLADYNFSEEQLEIIKSQNINEYKIIKNSCIQSDDYLKTIIKALELFLGESVGFLPDCDDCFVVGDIDDEKFLNEKSFYIMREVIKKQCGNSKKDDDEFNVKSDEAKKLAEKFKKAREKINKHKQKSGENLSLKDLISAFSYYNKGIDITRVWDMTLYQFTDQFQRMQLVSDYEVNIQSLLHGADSNKVKLKHFISKI